LEVGNTLLVAERRNRISNLQLHFFLDMLSILNIEVEQESPERMLGEIVLLARKYQLSTYDASYLDLAIRRGLPLATQDKALLKAADNCGVNIYAPVAGEWS
jgi:predicted nucleic acid-binding protein